MKILSNGQYKYVEACLFNYTPALNSTNTTDANVFKAINETISYFKGTSHEIMMREYYFNAKTYLKKYTRAGHFTHVCLDLVHTEEPNGYVMRREIVYRVAMMFYALGIFTVKNFEEN